MLGALPFPPTVNFRLREMLAERLSSCPKTYGIQTDVNWLRAYDRAGVLYTCDAGVRVREGTKGHAEERHVW